MMCEHFLDYPEFPERYEVGTNGTIRNKKTGHSVSPHISDNRYPKVKLYSDDGTRVTRSVNRMVGYTHIPNPNGYSDVFPSDGDRNNLKANNLMWGTRHEHRIIMCENHNDRRILNITTGEVYSSISEAASAIGGDRANVFRCVNGLQGSYLGFEFCYI